MDKESLEKLIADQPKEIRAKGVLLFNGAEQCAQTYQSAPTAANLRDWEAAQAALAKFAADLGAKADPDQPFPALPDVLAHLQEEGWKITKATLYRHQAQGKLLPQADGAFARRAVEKYAKTWLKQQSTGQRINDRMDELQRLKIENEIALQGLDRKRKQLAYDRDMGLLIPRELVEMELAGRAGVLDAGLKHWVQSRTAEWIRTAGGDTTRVGDLINLMTRDLDEHLNSYAAPVEYRIVIDEEEPEDTEPEEMAAESAEAEPC